MNKQTFPIAVLDEHPNWLNPLYEKFNERGIDYIKLDVSSASYDPENTAIFPFYINRLSPSASKRGHDSAFAYTLNYIQYLESLGARVINGSHTVLLETNKALQAALLRRLAISQPKSVVLNDLFQIKKYLDTFSFPVVIKPNRGGSGMFIKQFNTKEALQEAITNNEITMPSDNLVLLQEFIESRDGYIVRVETINKKVVYGMKVYTTGIFNLCPSDSCDLQRIDTSNQSELGYCVATPTNNVRFELYKQIPKEIVKAVETIVKEANLDCGGIEYVVGKNGQWYVYDINALSILRTSFKDEYGIDGWAMLADYFIAEYTKVLRRK